MIDIPDSVFPVNSGGKPVCPRCGAEASNCVCPEDDPDQRRLERSRVTVRLEKSGRKGKTVTVIENLPGDESFLKTLARRLKSKTGSGGTCYTSASGGVIELQGDHRVLVDSVLASSDTGPDPKS